MNFDTHICAIDEQHAILTVLTFEETERQRVQNGGSYRSLLALLQNLLLFNLISEYKLLNKRGMVCRHL